MKYILTIAILLFATALYGQADTLAQMDIQDTPLSVAVKMLPFHKEQIISIQAERKQLDEGFALIKKEYEATRTQIQNRLAIAIHYVALTDETIAWNYTMEPSEDDDTIIFIKVTKSKKE